MVVRTLLRGCQGVATQVVACALLVVVRDFWVVVRAFLGCYWGALGICQGINKMLWVVARASMGSC